MEDKILTDNLLQKTECRKKVLQILQYSDTALSEDEILSRVDKKFNKTSVYRTLNTFSEKRIIHRIITGMNVAKYSISKNNMPENHIHFECKKCCSVYCFSEYSVNNLKLPEGFEKEESNILVVGICKKCKN